MPDTAGTTPTSDGTTNSPNEATCETRSEENWRKKDSGIVVDQDQSQLRLSRPGSHITEEDQDRTDKEDSAGNAGKEDLQPQVCDSSSEPKLEGEGAKAKVACDTEEEPFAVGDKVAIKVSENDLVELQEDFGGCTESMIKVIYYT